jgi:hypothetical protein
MMLSLNGSDEYASTRPATADSAPKAAVEEDTIPEVCMSATFTR